MQAKPMTPLLLILAIAIFAWPIVAAEEETSSEALTIYSTARPGAIPADLYRPLPGGAQYGISSYGRIPGYALVKSERPLELEKGKALLRFSDVAALIDPTTVRFESITDPQGTTVLEQNYQFDLVSQQKLVERFLDREIVVEQIRGESVEEVRGRLLSANGGLTLELDDGSIRTLSGWSGIRFPELPGGLITRPTLEWQIRARKGGMHRTRVAYQTQGMTWWADYNLVFRPGGNPNTGTLDVGAWVSILNQSGAGYEQARLKLIAGDVQRASSMSDGYSERMRPQKVMALADDGGFSEKSFFEYHLYTLARRTTLPDQSTKQIELFDAAEGVEARKILLYVGQAGVWGGGGSPATDRNFGLQSNSKVDVFLEFENIEKQGLGVPLPSGRVRVNQIDPDDGSLEFIGEDVIDHTPRNESVRVRLGSAFDVVGQRKQLDFRIDNARHWMEETIEIELRNRKQAPIEMLVKESLYRWVNWEIIESTEPWEKVDARTLHFRPTVAADEVKRIVYKVRYSWK